MRLVTAFFQKQEKLLACYVKFSDRKCIQRDRVLWSFGIKSARFTLRTSHTESSSGYCDHCWAFSAFAELTVHLFANVTGRGKANAGTCQRNCQHHPWEDFHD